jgi:uncharacterized protein DUF397
MTPDEASLRWRKSSYSGGNGGECIELTYPPGLIRDSKNPAGPSLEVNIQSLLTAVKDGQLG